MPRGFFTSLFFELNISYWYLVILSFLLKIFLLRVMTKESNQRTFYIFLTGSLIFYLCASLGGILFSKVNFYFIPLCMFLFGVVIEILFSSIAFHLRIKRIYIPILVGNGSLFAMLFMMLL